MQRYLNTYSPYLRTSIETKHKFVAIENRLKSIGLIPYQADHEEIVPLLRQQLPYIELSSTVKEAKKLIKFSLEQVRWSHLFGQSDGLSKVYSAV